jgi:D-beta-D-heptose 7-phosphate kinase/D-beta-D-heptose 1-phosphate adenosyltransferase
MTSDSKILDRAELGRRLERARGEGRRIVFTNGVFDLLHVGHLRYLEAARREGDLLVVAINSDASTRRLKGPTRPILPADQRKRVLAGLACVDFVTEFDEDTPHATLEALRPDVLVKGATYGVEEVIGREVVRGYGGEVKTLGLTEGASTTKFIESIRHRDV